MRGGGMTAASMASRLRRWGSFVALVRLIAVWIVVLVGGGRGLRSRTAIKMGTQPRFDIGDLAELLGRELRLEIVDRFQQLLRTLGPRDCLVGHALGER